jgi:hypothetical protein
MDSMKSATEIKEKALAMGAKAVGIASVEAINRVAPPGHRPSDQLNSLQSVNLQSGGASWRSPSKCAHLVPGETPSFR